MNAGGRFLRHALDRLHCLGEEPRTLLQHSLQHGAEDFFFFIRRREKRLARFNTSAPERKHGGVAAIVQDHVAGLVASSEARRVGKGGVSTCSSRWTPYTNNKQKKRKAYP